MHEIRPPEERDAVPAGPAATAAGHRREPLSRDRIMGAAVDFIDAHCLSDLSMRRLGAELGVEAMSLYRYFPSKAALLDDVICGLMKDLTLPNSDETDWEGSVRAYARSFRDVARRHPQLYPLLATAAPRNRTMAEVIGRMLSMWQRTGVDPDRAAQAQCAVQGFITGATLWAVSRDGVDIDGPEVETRPAEGPTRADAEFEFGLEVLVAGLRQTLPRRPSAGAPVGRADGTASRDIVAEAPVTA
jgi:AcrR family transcriptional regulator